MTRRKRVAVVTTVHVPGDTRIWHKQVQSLAANGYDVHYLACDSGDLGESPHVTLHDLGPRRMRPMARLTRLAGIPSRLAAIHPDIVHFHDPELLPVLSLARMRAPWALVFDIHEDIRKQLLIKAWLPSWSRRLVAAAYHAIERFCLRLVDLCVLAEDSYVASYEGRNSLVIKNYPIVERVAGSARKPKAPKRFCYVGGVSEERGIADLLRAFPKVCAEVPGASLIIAGPLRPPLSQEGLRDLAASLGIGDAVQILGRVPLAEAYDIISNSDVGVAPLRAVGNYVESLPTKMFEYMSCGLPVVVSDFPLWRSIVEDSGCGAVFPSGDVEGLADAMIDVTRDLDRYVRWSSRGIRAVQERYTWSHEEASLLAAYSRLNGGSA